MQPARKPWRSLCGIWGPFLDRICADLYHVMNRGWGLVTEVCYITGFSLGLIVGFFLDLTAQRKNLQPVWRVLIVLLVAAFLAY